MALTTTTATTMTTATAADDDGSAGTVAIADTAATTEAHIRHVAPRGGGEHHVGEPDAGA
jgi:hypothetical protein